MTGHLRLPIIHIQVSHYHDPSVTQYTEVFNVFVTNIWPNCTLVT